MPKEDLLEIVEQINYDLYDCAQSLVMNKGIVCQLSSIGYDSVINFLDVTIWNSDCDERPTDENGNYTISINDYVRSQINKLIEGLKVIKL